MANLDPAAAQDKEPAAPPALEPPFPYVKIPFDADFFSADREVDIKALGK